jgi:pyruvate dehydrogenase E2 component (dihydrolipoamide acetyltransferase)
LPIAYCLLPIAYCLLPIAYCLFPIAYSLFPIPKDITRDQQRILGKMIHEVFMPALSSTMTEGKIVSWVKAAGDKVEKGETVVVVESDKADMDVESFYEGFLATIIVAAGDVAPVGSAIALVAETEAEIAQAVEQGKSASTTKQTPKAPAKASAVGVAVQVETALAQKTENNGRVAISPRARKLAKELKVDFNTIKGTGPNGRIIAEDVQAAAGVAVTSPVAPVTPVAPVVSTPVTAAPVAPRVVPAPTPAVMAGDRVVVFNTLQKAVAQNMTASLGAPVFRVGYTITTDNLDKLYKQIKSKGVTMTALLAKAVAMTLQKHPLLNACYTEGGIQYRGSINISLAVAMDDGGLITPVLPNADKTDIYSLSRLWKDLVERARTKQLQPAEYSTGTFAMTNLGMFGVDKFDAILPSGQGSILAVGASRPTVVANSEGLMGVKQQMQVNITCDHRVIYGADAASFLQDLAKLIESNPQSLTL